MRQIFRLLTLPLTTLIFTASSTAQTYPAKPIRVIVGFPVGSTVDTFTRAISVHMQKQVGQPLIVDARPGAGSSIAAHAVIKAAPDGYTLHFGIIGSLLPALVKNNPVDARKDLAPISDMLSSPFVLYSSAKLPVKTLQELIAYSNANPSNTLNFASTNSQIELMMQLVKNSTGITYTLINYPGAPVIIPAMINGDVAIAVNTFGAFIPHLAAGTIRALFISAPKRMPQFPGVPTAREVGITNVDGATFDLGFWAPRGTPKEIADQLSQAPIAGVHMPDIANLALNLGYEAVGSTPEAQLRKYEAAFQFWTDTARLTNFQPQ